MLAMSEFDSSFYYAQSLRCGSHSPPFVITVFDLWPLMTTLVSRVNCACDGRILHPFLLHSLAYTGKFHYDVPQIYC